jgi:RNA polymerase sigma factor FliA
MLQGREITPTSTTPPHQHIATTSTQAKKSGRSGTAVYNESASGYTAPQLPSSAKVDQDELIVNHIPLVKVIAHRLVQRLPSQVEMADLISVGVLGLIDATSRYQPARGVPFDAFCRRRVQGAMLDALRDLDWAPRAWRRLRRDFDAAIGQLTTKLKREPTERELMDELQMTQAEYDVALEQLRTLEVGAVGQLDAVAQEGTSLLEAVVATDPLADELLLRKEVKMLLAKALLDLPERERHILALYYEEEMTMAQIGGVIGVCESRVSQLRSLALSRLRSSLREPLASLPPMKKAGAAPARIATPEPAIAA